MFIKKGLHFEIAPEFSEYSPWLCAVQEHFSKNPEIVHAIRNTIKNFDVGTHCFTVKAFQIPYFINSFAYGYVRSSKAKRSYQNAQMLIAKGINTPKPVAWIEFYKYGMLKESYYISLCENFETTMHGHAQYTKAEQEKLIQSFVHYIVHTLHKNNIRHLDFSPGNILISRDEDTNFTFSLVDLNRMKEVPLNFSEGLANLAKLNPRHFEIIAKEYARLHGRHSPEEQEEALRQLTWYYKKRMFLPTCRKIARSIIRSITSKVLFWRKP